MHKKSPEFYTFAGYVLYNMGMTGFDSEISLNISMPSHEIALVKIDFKL